jgi:hypothetical protein
MAVCVVAATLTMAGTATADVTLNAWNKVVTPGTYNLGQGDITASLTLDFTNIPVGWNVFQFGLAAQGQTNWDTGVWLQVRPHGSASTVSGGYDVFDMNEHILLQRRKNPASDWPTTEEPAYDATNPTSPVVQTPFGTTRNVGFYYDRGAVTDPVQQGLFGWSDGGNYNTGGIYHIDLVFKQVSDTQGVVFATINGVSQGIYASTSPNYGLEPDYYPAGLSFTTADLGGSFSDLKVWFGQAGAGGGYSVVSNVEVVPEPATMALLGLGLATLVARRAQRKR